MSGTVHIIVFPTDEDEDGYFGQESPPLTDEIREILEEYPDGQIFKVSIVFLALKKKIMQVLLLHLCSGCMTFACILPVRTC